ncbi:MAG TPA: SAM-dependent methyltransferase [Sphingomicrobium sp.]|nr:SAM-dependent methyltransferase [Sphingomicrobium sp.]
MTPLERALRERIEAEGALSVEAYMEACNEYYYATRDPLGERGDFTTAPEISQMFGEMIGAWLADAWKHGASPGQAIYAELGPGRGTLANDALRVLRAAGFEGEAHLIETSPLLKAVQQKVLETAHFHEAIDELPPQPLLLVANEFLDALPIRQFVGAVERSIVLERGVLAFDRGGEIVEDSPARNEAVSAVARHLAQHGGVALFIDYGHLASAPGDTLQAVRGHEFAPVLESAGEQDLTAHVDFEAVARASNDAGAKVTAIVSQGEWLGRIGVEARAKALSFANPEREGEIEAALHRLAGPAEMGTLFKVIAVHSPEWPSPAGFE